MTSLNIPALNELIAHLEGQPEVRFNMGWQYFENHPCGTAACIHGHSYALWKDKVDDFTKMLCISEAAYDELTMPLGWTDERDGVRRYPLSRAIATLKRLRDHYLATGEIVVDWGPEPGQEPKRPWSAPLVTGGLPASLTDALDGVAPSLVVEVAR